MVMLHAVYNSGPLQLTIIQKGDQVHPQVDKEKGKLKLIAIIMVM